MAGHVDAAAREWEDLARGAAGGFLFGIPLLYTMELWFTGLSLSATHALLLVAFALGFAFLFALVIGFRDEQEARLSDAALEAVEAVAIAILVATFVLLVLGRIGPSGSADSAVGRVAIQLLPVTLGVAIANHLLPRGSSRQGGAGEDRPTAAHASPTVRDLFAASAGALLLSLNIAPTDEVRMIAGELDELRLILLVLCSLGVTYLVVFEAGFGDQEARRGTEGLLQSPLTETVAAYVVALVICACALALLGAFPSGLPAGAVLGQVVVLGFPAALGAAAGRLVV